MAENEKDDANKELLIAVRSLQNEIRRLRHSNEGAAGGGILAELRSGRLPRVEPIQPETPEKKSKTKESSSARQVLVAYYMLRALGWRFDIHGNKKPAITLIAALTNRDPQTVKVALHNIEQNGAERKDLEYVLPLFQAMNLRKISAAIEKNLEK
jgi:hypothetical protein